MRWFLEVSLVGIPSLVENQGTCLFLVLRIQTKENPFEGCALVFARAPSLFVYVKLRTKEVCF